MKRESSLTIKTISQKTGISVSTISRVLNGKAKKYRISDKTAEIILRTAKELNYSPNQMARGLRLKRSYTLGYIIPDISNPFFARIAQSVEKSARKKGYSVILSDTGEDTSVEISTVQLLLDRHIDGLIISPVGRQIQHLINLKKKNIPVVLIDRYFPELGFPYVASDNFKGAFEAVKYLLDNGHKNIACIQGLINTLPNSERVRGYIEAHRYCNVEYDRDLIVGDSFGEQNGYIETKLLLQRKAPITAIFGISNLISFGALKALTEAGLNIPDNISLITFDDQPYLSFLSTPITAVKQQRSAIGDIATKLLIDQIETGAGSENKGIILPTRLIIRNSVKKLN